MWKKSNQTSTAKVFKNHIGCYLRTPVVTRWNSVYDSVKHILEFKNQLVQIYDDLGTECRLNGADITYLENYTLLMQPIAMFIDHLQVSKST